MDISFAPYPRLVRLSCPSVRPSVCRCLGGKLTRAYNRAGQSRAEQGRAGQAGQAGQIKIREEDQDRVKPSERGVVSSTDGLLLPVVCLESSFKLPT